MPPVVGVTQKAFVMAERFVRSHTLADVDAAHPVPVQRLITDLVHASPPARVPGCQPAKRYRPGIQRARENLTRVLEATMNSPSKDQIPAPDYSTASPAPLRKRRHERYPPPFSRRYGAGAADTRTIRQTRASV